MAETRIQVSLPGHVEANLCLVLPLLVTSSPPNIPVEFIRQRQGESPPRIDRQPGGLTTPCLAPGRQ